MTPKKPKTLIYKHAELAEKMPLRKSPVAGFSADVNMELLLPDIDLFKFNFRSDFLSLIMIEAGEMILAINLEEIHGTAGSLLLINPDATKKIVSATPDSSISIVNFTLDFLANFGMLKMEVDLMEYFSLKYLPHWKLEPQDSVLVHKQIQELHNRSEDALTHPYGSKLLHHAFYIFLYEMAALSKKYAQPVSLGRSRKENLLINFTQLVKSQFKSQRNLESYARSLNVTAKHLSKTVKETSGKTAGEIIDDFVLLEARLLLDNPELSIQEIANELHFSDQSFFGKFFKRHTGVSPKQYRQSLQDRI
ncbi:helix-turn-helix domain-containing protein [Niastella sp. OAS944]|uniref:helix-turn-helix domain-containing protein n=1 Tax=Niastella sp. OAS944 TaxID=2664089 RepID=UPI00346EBF5E|nr:AraC-like DNA-binding protein [Chitinophagaceae bacterium OAS944]